MYNDFERDGGLGRVSERQSLECKRRMGRWIMGMWCCRVSRLHDANAETASLWGGVFVMGHS
jgi:hypothetical protein